jgi:flagellin-specific chaperone FliS
LSNLDKVLDAAIALPLEQQEMLVKILQNRINESIRDEIAKDAKDAIAEFKVGNYKLQTAKEVIQELRESLNSSSGFDV